MPEMTQILFSAYNGMKYLESQLDSLKNQTLQNIEILARDDGSSDGTISIFEQSGISVLKDQFGNLKPAQSFGVLLAASSASHVLCCDQDDVWLPQKLERMTSVMNRLESLHGSHTPILLHHDLEVVDADLKTIAPSLWAWRGLDVVNGVNLNRLLLQNVVTGCALMANRALLNKALPLPQEAVMHDWWLALVASSFGIIEALPESLVKYRQHGGNSLGARRLDAGFVLQNIIGKAVLKPSIEARVAQAQAFLERFEDSLQPEQLEVVRAFATLREASWFERRRRLARYDFRFSGILRNLLWWCSV
jgi:glycosyltransferase involved in cell wall biosynthesis